MVRLESQHFEHIFWCPKGTCLEDSVTERDGWYFWDEVGHLGGGPYDTEQEAQRQLVEYCRVVLEVVVPAHAEGEIQPI